MKLEVTLYISTWLSMLLAWLMSPAMPEASALAIAAMLSSLFFQVAHGIVVTGEWPEKPTRIIGNTAAWTSLVMFGAGLLALAIAPLI